MKKTALMLLLLAAICLGALPAQAALQIDTTMSESGENRIVSMIMANPKQGDEALSDEESALLMQAIVDANTLIQTRFPLAQYLIAMNRVGDREDGIDQTLRLYQDGASASIAVIWQGEQADGTRGSSVQSLALDLENGEEILFDDLFAEPDAAAAAMEAIIEREIVEGLSDYMEYADLLPMPRDSFSYDEQGLTVYYPQERYLYFSGRSGAVHFAWHEIDEYIGEGSPLYALSRPKEEGTQAIEQQIQTGRLPGALSFGLGDLLGEALDSLTLLADPDYTTESLVYQFEEEALRGFALEIPKYAETDEEETPISAIRASRAALCGLVTGETTCDAAVALMGEPENTRSYDRDAADDMMLRPGESLLYTVGEHVLQLHFDEAGVLSAILLRAEMPGDLL